MTNNPNRQNVAKGMTWAARVIVLGATAFLLLAWLLQMVFRAALWASDILYLVYLGIALAGCIVSWWRQWLAGTLLVLASFALSSLGSRYYGFRGLVSGFPYLVAGVLFLLSWWLSRKTGSSVAPSTPKL